MRGTRDVDGASGPRPKKAWAGYAACALALGHAAVSFSWASGGTAGLPTVGGELEAMGRAVSLALAAAVWGVGVAKVLDVGLRGYGARSIILGSVARLGGRGGASSFWG